MSAMSFALRDSASCLALSKFTRTQSLSSTVPFSSKLVIISGVMSRSLYALAILAAEPNATGSTNTRFALKESGKSSTVRRFTFLLYMTLFKSLSLDLARSSHAFHSFCLHPNCIIQPNQLLVVSVGLLRLCRPNANPNGRISVGSSAAVALIAWIEYPCATSETSNWAF